MKSWTDYLKIIEEIDPSSKGLFRELPKISVVGCFQNGKSTFINCLLDKLVARPGDGRATTKISTRYRWGESTNVSFRTNQGLEPITLEEYLKCANISQISQTSAFQAEFSLPTEILRNIELIDTPGFDANEQDTDNVTRSLDEANYAIVVLTNKRTLGEPEARMFEFIKSKNIPYAVIMNCRDINIAMEWYPTHKKNMDIIKENEAIFERWGCTPEKIDGNSSIYPCNFLWYWFATNMNKSLIDYDDDLSDKIELVLNRKNENLSKNNIIRLSNVLEIKSFFRHRLAHIN